jgi:hypothetical protein
MASLYPQILIEIRQNAPGLPGAYILEHLGPYQQIDEMRLSRPSAVAAIGGHLKRLFLTKSLGIWSYEHQSIALARVDRCLVFDCELHQVDERFVPRLRGGPVAANLTHHHLKHAPQSLLQLSQEIYKNVISNLSDVVLIFVPDFGGVANVVEFLRHWVQHARLQAQEFLTFKQRILLIHERNPSKGEVYSLLVAAIAGELRISDPNKACTASITQTINSHVQLTDLAMSDDVHKAMQLEVAKSFRERVRRSCNFNAIHYKSLLQTAISKYVEDPSWKFDFISASRLVYPVPARLEITISDYLRNGGTHEEYLKAVASALAADAFPPEMHRESHVLPSPQRPIA